jgi:hypothetical protein
MDGWVILINTIISYHQDKHTIHSFKEEDSYYYNHMTSGYPKKQTQPSYTIVGAFRPFPTIKSLPEPVMKNNISRIMYAAAENLFRSYPFDVPLLIYQYHYNDIGYDVFIERTCNGWKEWINTYSIPFQKEPTTYMVDGLALALQQEKEMTSILPIMMRHVNTLFRTLELSGSYAL